MTIPVSEDGTLKFVYKKSVTTKKFVAVGTVDEYGFITFDIPNDKSISKPDYYFQDFYMDVQILRAVQHQKVIKNSEGEEISTENVYINTYVPSGEKRLLTPKNPPHQQIFTLKGSIEKMAEGYFVTGYVTNDGIAVYYDQYL